MKIIAFVRAGLFHSDQKLVLMYSEDGLFVIERSPLLAEVVDEDNSLFAVKNKLEDQNWSLHMVPPVDILWPGKGHGSEVDCPNCGEPGTLDLFGEEIHFENSIWWDDWYFDFECCRCSKEID